MIKIVKIITSMTLFTLEIIPENFIIAWLVIFFLRHAVCLIDCFVLFMEDIVFENMLLYKTIHTGFVWGSNTENFIHLPKLIFCMHLVNDKKEPILSLGHLSMNRI